MCAYLHCLCACYVFALSECAVPPIPICVLFPCEMVECMCLVFHRSGALVLHLLSSCTHLPCLASVDVTVCRALVCPCLMASLGPLLPLLLTSAFKLVRCHERVLHAFAWWALFGVGKLNVQLCYLAVCLLCGAAICIVCLAVRLMFLCPLFQAEGPLYLV